MLILPCPSTSGNPQPYSDLRCVDFCAPTGLIGVVSL